SRRSFGEDLFTSGIGQRIVLQTRGLVFGRHSRIADAQCEFPVSKTSLTMTALEGLSRRYLRLIWVGIRDCASDAAPTSKSVVSEAGGSHSGIKAEHADILHDGYRDKCSLVS